MNLFICSTPFQIMNALNIVLKNSSGINDLYILDHSRECYEIFERLKDCGVFDNVYFLKTTRRYRTVATNRTKKLLVSFKKAFNAINSKYLVDKLPTSDENYKKVYLAYPDMPSQIIYFHFKKMNKNIELSFIEDGVYTYNAFNTKVTLIRRIFSTIVFGSDIMKECKNIYVYSPQLVNIRNYNIDTFPIEFIDRKDTRRRNMFNQIFGFREPLDNLVKSNFILFDQPFQLERIQEKQQRIFIDIVEKVGTMRISLKLHPRSSTSNYHGLHYIETKSPFEILNFNNRMDDKILISGLSTACLSPKMIFDEEPYIILLFKLFNLTDLHPQLIKVVDDVTALYRDPKKIYIPRTELELNEILETLVCLVKDS